MNAILSHNGLSTIPDKASYREIFCFPVEKYYLKAGFDFKVIPFDELAHQFITTYREKSPKCGLMPQAEAVVQKLNELDFRQTIISASRQDYLDSQVFSFPFSHYFEGVHGISDIFARTKVDIARNWMAKSDESPATTVFIGDTLHDYEVASAIGCHCILYNNGHQRIDQTSISQSGIVDSLEEIFGIISALQDNR